MTLEQAEAFAQLRALAATARLRVRPDTEGWPVIPGRFGQIEWYCNGQDPGEPALAVYMDRPRLFPKFWALPGVRRWQTGDREIRAVFQPEALTLAAGVIRARRRAARVMTPARLAGLAAAREKLRGPVPERLPGSRTAPKPEPLLSGYLRGARGEAHARDGEVGEEP
jgi:hypothetical protein